MTRNKNIEPSAVTFVAVAESKYRANVSLCYMLKYPDKINTYWDTKIVKQVKTDNAHDYMLLIEALSAKFHIPFIPGIKKGMIVSVGHKNILLIQHIFVYADKEMKHESITQAVE